GFNAGGKFDPANQTGLSSLTADLLKEGTKTRAARQIADELAGIGGNLAIDSSPDFLVVSGSVLSENLDKQVEILADVVRNASFPDEEVALRKENEKQELMDARSRSETLVEEKFMQTLFGANPYAKVLPTAESIDRIDRAAISSFRDRFLSPNNAILTVVGALPPKEQLAKLLEAQFGSWPKKDKPAEPTTAIPEPARAIILVDRPGSVQADVRVGQVGISRDNPDYFPMVVGSSIFGGGPSSRMFMNIRERLGFAYDAHSELVPMKSAGYVAAVTQVRNEVVEPAMTELLKEMDDMGKARTSAEELSATKNYLNGGFVMRMATPAGIAAQLSTIRLLGLSDDYLERYVSRVRNVEPDQVQKAAARFLAPSKTSIVVVGDAAKIQKSLEKFGPVKVEKAQ
ncbi:MAG: pitrilysin family protein, partial [Bryobacteraceae bacterium]